MDTGYSNMILDGTMNAVHQHGVPEPGPASLFGFGVLATLLLARRKKAPAGK